MRITGKYISENPGDRQGRQRGGAERDEQVAKLIRLIQALCRRVQAAEEAAQDLQVYGDDLQGEGLPELSPHKPARPRRPLADDETGILKRLANLGAMVTIARDPDGSATVTVSQSQDLRLKSSVLTDLIEALCADTGSRNDNLVGWKPTEELRRLLKEKKGAEVTPRSLAVSIHRLRTALKTMGLNQFLVQSDRRLGFRFARRFKDPPEIGGVLK